MDKEMEVKGRRSVGGGSEGGDAGQVEMQQEGLKGWEVYEVAVGGGGRGVM